MSITRISSVIVVAAACWSLAARAESDELSYVGSSTIGEKIIEPAARTCAARTGIKFDHLETQGSGKGLEMVLNGEAQLSGVARSLTLTEKQARIHYQIIGYDAVGIFVHPDNPVTTLTRRELKGIFTGRINNWKDVGGRDARIVVVTLTLRDKRGQLLEFQNHALDGAPFRADRVEVDRQSTMLAGWGMKPTVVGGGIEALAFLECARADGASFPMVLLDGRMPDMDGFAVAERIRTTPTLAGVTLVLATSDLKSGDLARNRALGVARTLVKPVTLSELLDAILLALGQASHAVHVSSTVTPAARSLRALVTEDNDVNQRVIVGLLKKLGHSAVIAANGQEASRGRHGRLPGKARQAPRSRGDARAVRRRSGG
jgi:CheY-like chemotaxis protein